MDKIGMGVICKNCGKVVLEHFIGDLCPTQFKPATPVPTQSSEVGPYKTVPSISCPGFYTLQENRINIFGPAKLRECHDYMAYARKGFALGQSTARSQEGRELETYKVIAQVLQKREGRLREALGKIASLPHAPRCIYAAGKYSGTISKCNCGKGIAEQALTASQEASQEGGTNE